MSFRRFTLVSSGCERGCEGDDEEGEERGERLLVDMRVLAGVQESRRERGS